MFMQNIGQNANRVRMAYDITMARLAPVRVSMVAKIEDTWNRMFPTTSYVDAREDLRHMTVMSMMRRDIMSGVDPYITQAGLDEYVAHQEHRRLGPLDYMEFAVGTDGDVFRCFRRDPEQDVKYQAVLQACSKAEDGLLAYEEGLRTGEWPEGCDKEKYRALFEKADEQLAVLYGRASSVSGLGAIARDGGGTNVSQDGCEDAYASSVRYCKSRGGAFYTIEAGAISAFRAPVGRSGKGAAKDLDMRAGAREEALGGLGGASGDDRGISLT